MGATLLFRNKKIRDGLIIELVIWELDTPVKGCSHRFKYRLFCGNHETGACLVRYDNEQGKGDHRHVAQREEPYRFTSLEGLLSDFERDVREALQP